VVPLAGLHLLATKVEAVVRAITLSREVTGFETIKAFSLKA
jgi:hypothetical protein